MAAAPGRFLSSGTKWRPQAEPGGAAFPLPLGSLEIYGLCAPSCADQRARLTCGRVAGAAGILTWDPGTACERGRPRASAGGTRPAAGPGRWRGTSEADESGARPPGGEEVCGPYCGMSHSGDAKSEALGPLWALAAEALSAGGFMVEAAGGQEAAFLRENKGPARRGRLPPSPGPSLVASRKLSQTGPGGGTRCSFVRAEWGGGACCHVVAPVFQRLSTRALCKKGL